MLGEASNTMGHLSHWNTNHHQALERPSKMRIGGCRENWGAPSDQRTKKSVLQPQGVVQSCHWLHTESKQDVNCRPETAKRFDAMYGKVISNKDPIPVHVNKSWHSRWHPQWWRTPGVDVRKLLNKYAAGGIGLQVESIKIKVWLLDIVQ